MKETTIRKNHANRCFFYFKPIKHQPGIKSADTSPACFQLRNAENRPPSPQPPSRPPGNPPIPHQSDRINTGGALWGEGGQIQCKSLRLFALNLRLDMYRLCISISVKSLPPQAATKIAGNLSAKSAEKSQHRNSPPRTCGELLF